MQSEFISRIQQIDHLIKIKGTGSPDDFAARLGISRRSLYDYINRMKEGGAPIKYDHYRASFYYAEEGNFKISFSFYKEQIGKTIISFTGYSSLFFLSQFI